MEIPTDDCQDNKGGINTILTSNLISIGHLKIYIRMRYSSLKQAGIDAGLSQGRVRQIINGFCLPENSDLIKQIAKGWNIDAVVLTKLFDKYRQKKEVQSNG